jgi:geranylgeranyl diphosphate synthase type II
MDVREKLEADKTAVESRLTRILSDTPDGLREVMGYAVLEGGKRFRPLLLIAAGEALGEGLEPLLPYACAVELIHCYSLVHDDLPAMDDDDFRRGKPSCHKAFGEAQAILAGDGLLSLAFEVLSRAPSAAGRFDRKERAFQEIASAAGVGGMIKGQWMDITLGGAGTSHESESVFMELAGRKTGALIRASVRAGAVLAGAPGAAVEAAGSFGASLGLAFQLRDDILDAREPGASTGFDAVSLFGREGAAERLKACLDGGLGALEAGGIDSDELRFLAGTLRLGKGS